MNNKKYPQGKLNDQDEGETEIAIGEENGCVVIKFPKPVLWAAFDPDQAVDIASALIKRAKNLGLTKPITIEL